MLADLGVGDDALGTVARHGHDAGERCAEGGGDRRAHACASWAMGCRRTIGWPGATGSPSSTSHSTTVPPCGATTGMVSRSVSTVPDGGARRDVVARRRVGAEPERALDGGHQQAPRRLVLHVGGPAVLVDEAPGGGQVVGGLDGERLDAGERALDQAREGAGRRDLDDGGDAEVGHGRHAAVPPHGVAHLGDEPAEHVAAVVHDPPVGVGDQRDPGIVRRHRPRVAAQDADGGRHVLGVERAGDLERAHAGPLGRVGGEGGELVEGAGDDDLAGAVHVGRGQAVLGGLGDDHVRVAAEHGAHAGGRDGGGCGHLPAALADEDHGLLGGEDARAHRGGDLADGVPGAGADAGEGVARVGEHAEQGDEPGPDDERLGDGGVADGLGVRDGAVLDEVDAADHGQPVEAFAHPGDFQPGGEEAGRLGALSGRDDNEHPRSLPWCGGDWRCWACQSRAADFVGILQGVRRSARASREPRRGRAGPGRGPPGG